MKKKATCGYCKKEIKKSSKKCPHCGKEFEMFKNSKKWVANNWGALVGAVWGLISIYFLFGMHKGWYAWIYAFPILFAKMIVGTIASVLRSNGGGDIGFGIALIFGPIIAVTTGFLVGWGIHALIRKLIKKIKEK